MLTDWLRSKRGLLAHSARSTGIGLWSFVCGLSSLLLGFGWFPVKKKVEDRRELFALHLARSVWRRLMNRSRKMRERHKRAHNITGALHKSADESFGEETKDATGEETWFERATRQARDAYGHYDGPTMTAVAAEYAGLSRGIYKCAMSVATLVANVRRDMPLPGHINSAVQQVTALITQASEQAGTAYHVFRSVHAHHLMRHEQPRKSVRAESRWNIVIGVQDDGHGVNVDFRPSFFDTCCAQMLSEYQDVSVVAKADAVREFSGIGGGLQSVAQTVERLTSASRHRYPVDQRVVEHLSRTTQTLYGAVYAARQVTVLVQRHLAAKALEASSDKK